MAEVRDLSGQVATSALDRLASAPISWGVCEVPGWGPMLPAERVLAEMAQLGLRGTELGAPGFLPDDGAAVAAVLNTYGLELVGGFVPLVLHQRDAGPGLDAARVALAKLAAARGEVMVLALVEDEAWSTPRELDDAGWRFLSANIARVQELARALQITVALHPHVGTLVETAEQVRRALDELEVGWCLDTGHLSIGGYDPLEFAQRHAGRVVHVHLKDVSAGIASRVRAGEISLLEATREGLFRPLGQGDVDIRGVLAQLEAAGYRGWLVLEQDTVLTDPPPPTGTGPLVDVRASLDFLRLGA